MMMITKMMKVVVNTKLQVCSFFQFPISVIRNYFTLDNSLVQLSAEMDTIYNYLKSKTPPFSMPRDKFNVLQQQILNGIYVLSPLRMKYVRRVHFLNFIRNTSVDCPDFFYYRSKNPDFFLVIMPDKKDVLVFMGLCQMLYRLTYGSWPEGSYRILDSIAKYYSSIQNMGKADRLYRLELKEPLLHGFIDISDILKNVKPLVGDGSGCYNLISDFLNLPVIDDNGDHMNFGVDKPPSGELSRMLEDIVLRDIFDRELTKRFPGIVFSRFVTEVFIRGNDEVLFDEEEGYKLLAEASLYGDVQSIGPGDPPKPCYRKEVALDHDGKVLLLD